MGKKNRHAEGAQRKDAAASGAAAAKQPAAAATPGPAAAAHGPEVAPQHAVARVVGQDASGAPRDELLVTVLLPTVQSANDVRDLVIRAERISLRVAGKFRLELPLDTLVQETPLSVRLSKHSGELKIHLAVQQQGASTRVASSPMASSAPERRPEFEAQPASPSASATCAEAEALAREAMSAVQAEDLVLAQQLMAKAAQLMPAEYGEALELIEAAQRSVGAEEDVPVEPEPASADAAAAAPPATPVPESSGGGSARKAHKNKHRARTPAAATPPAAAPPAAAEPEPAAEAELDPEALEQHVTLEMVAAAVWLVWTGFLTEYLPLVADATGWADGEAYMRSALDADSPSRSKVLACATAVALLLAGLGVAFVLIVSRRALSLVASALSFCWQLVAAIARGIAWEPAWYIALPACSVAGVQTRLPLVSSFWLAPAWWWLLGGRMWALLGSVLCLGNLLLLGRANYAMAVLAWTLLRGAFIFTSWWLRVPAVLIILAAWAFCFLAWLHALANADLNASVPPGELPVDVPKDADGEVARILGCRTYYEVLELGEATDEESVRKAHRRKALLVHPDKCSSPYAKAAFQRVQDGFMLLKDKTSKREYDELLASAAHARATGTAAADEGDAGASGPRHRQRGRKGRR